MKRNKIFYNLIGIPIIAIMMLFGFSTKSEASIADFIAVMDTNISAEQTSAVRFRLWL